MFELGECHEHQGTVKLNVLVVAIIEEGCLDVYPSSRVIMEWLIYPSQGFCCNRHAKTHFVRSQFTHHHGQSANSTLHRS